VTLREGETYALGTDDLELINGFVHGLGGGPSGPGAGSGVTG
jgi:hypothetical protein